MLEDKKCSSRYPSLLSTIRYNYSFNIKKIEYIYYYGFQPVRSFVYSTTKRTRILVIITKKKKVYRKSCSFSSVVSLSFVKIYHSTSLNIPFYWKKKKEEEEINNTDMILLC